MKIKNILFGLLMLVSIVGLASCTSGDQENPGGNTDDSTDNPDVNPGGNTDDPDTNDEPKKDILYTVNVKMPDGTAANVANAGTEIKVQLCTAEGCKSPVKLNDAGKVEFEKSNQIKDTDTYFIHLLNVPEGYTYEANETLSSENKNITINLVNLSSYQSGTGDSATDAYKIASAGYYRTKLASEDDVVYFEFTPTEAGEYEVETLINLFDRMPESIFIPSCDPIMYLYSINEAGEVIVSETINDDISAANCNSKITLTVDEDAIANNIVYSFAIQLSKTSKAMAINASIDWEIDDISFSFSLLKK